MRKVKRALLSVYNKEGIVELAKGLREMDIEILTTGGTAKLLKENGIAVTLISEYTGYPEILDGRVKTLNPLIHGGILGRLALEAHRKEMEANNITPIDMVVVNLYPFEETISQEGVTLAEAIEKIDIGGPTMLRAAAKNYQEVASVVDPEDYPIILSALKKNDRTLCEDDRLRFAYKVFSHTSRYDSIVSNYFQNITDKDSGYDQYAHIRLEKVQDLRYGENPHQSAAFYRELSANQYGISKAKQLNGKELSFNNIIDIDAALQLVNEFDSSAAVVIKHTNPCGAAEGNNLLDAYKKARATDPLSAFGGIIGFNKTVDNETAKEVVSTFIEAVIAPDYDEDALATLQTKKNLRVLKAPETIRTENAIDIKRVSGGVLIQEADSVDLIEEKLKVVTKKEPTEDEWRGLRFAWKVGKHVKSNAIIYASKDETVGIGAGQMSRVDSSKLAVMKANKPVAGSVMASDAFFPFRDAIDAAAEAGITAIIQPGGSIRDEDVIEAANELNIAMVFTSIRHFKH